MLRQITKLIWAVVRGVLPYPDLQRRIRMRRAGFSLVTCKRWPGDNATGEEAAQLALLRLLWLQRLIRHAVRARRSEEAALLGRSAVDACIVGLYCLHSGTAVADLSAANNSAARRVALYVTDIGLMSEPAIDAAVQTLGEQGRDPNLKQWAEWLKREKGLWIAPRLYTAYYVPLSHFFAHTNAFTLTRHVRPDGRLRHRPAFPWARRSAVRLADGCAGLMAAAIAEKAGSPSAAFLTKYAGDHLERGLVPVFTLAARGWRRSVKWREVPAALMAIYAVRRYLDGSGRNDTPAKQEARVREGFTTAFGALGVDHDETFRVAIDQLVTLVLEEVNSTDPA
jgi:hypothetical protein